MSRKCGLCSTTKESLETGHSFCPNCDRRRCDSCQKPEPDVFTTDCSSCGATYNRKA